MTILCQHTVIIECACITEKTKIVLHIHLITLKKKCL